MVRTSLHDIRMVANLETRDQLEDGKGAEWVFSTHDGKNSDTIYTGVLTIGNPRNGWLITIIK